MEGRCHLSRCPRSSSSSSSFRLQVLACEHQSHVQCENHFDSKLVSHGCDHNSWHALGTFLANWLSNLKALLHNCFVVIWICSLALSQPKVGNLNSLNRHIGFPFGCIAATAQPVASKVLYHDSLCPHPESVDNGRGLTFISFGRILFPEM